VIWTIVFLIFYWFYGRKHSELEVGHPVVAVDPDDTAPYVPYTTNVAQPTTGEVRRAAAERKKEEQG
jgi:hypothetical protein